MHVFSIKEALLFGWNIVKKHFVFLVGIIVFVYAITMSIQFFSGFFQEISPFVSFALAVVGFVLSMMFSMGLITIALKFVRGEPVAFDDLFEPLPQFLPFLGGSILYSIIVILGMFLFVIPGVYWAIKYVLYQYLIIDKKMGPFAAFHASGEMTRGAKLKLLLLSLVIGALNMLGVLLVGIGILVTVPITMLAFAHVYDLLRKRHERTTKAPVERYQEPAAEKRNGTQRSTQTQATKNTNGTASTQQQKKSSPTARQAAAKPQNKQPSGGQSKQATDAKKNGGKK